MSTKTLKLSRKLRSLIDQNVWLDRNEPEVLVNGKFKPNPKIKRRERRILKALTGYRIEYLTKDIRKGYGRNEVVAYRPRVEPVYASGYTTPNFTGSGVWIVGSAKRGESIPAMSICVPKGGEAILVYHQFFYEAVKAAEGHEPLKEHMFVNRWKVPRGLFANWS